jgi:hypothetical protein
MAMGSRRKREGQQDLFLGYALDEATPDHSTISRTRRLY